MAQIDAELTFRPFDEKDFEPLAGLVGRTWLADFPVAAQRAAGRVELSHYLAQATWSLLAERSMEGPPMSMCSMASSKVTSGFATVFSNS